MKVKAIGFDWDGTLVNSMPTKAVIFAECILGRYPEFREKKNILAQIYLETAGTPLAIQYQKAFERLELDSTSEKSAQLIEELYRLFFAKTEHIYNPLMAPLFPDVVESLPLLRQHGYALFISSSVIQEQMDIVVRKYPDIVGFLEFILGEKPQFGKGKAHMEEAARRLKIDKSEIVFVGDGVGDVKAARQAEVPIIGVIRQGNGPKSEEKLRESAPDALITSLTELESELGKLGTRG